MIFRGIIDNVKKHFNHIKKDMRHNHIEIVVQSRVKNRIFNNFTMGFWQIEPSLTNIDKSKYELWELKENPQYLQTLFEALSSSN